MSAQLYAGIASGLNQVSLDMQQAPEREARREEALLRKQLAQQKLQDYQAAAPVRQTEQDVQLAQLQGQLRQANSANLQALTFDTFKRYDADGDARHLNTFIQNAKRNPVGANLYGTTVRIDNVTKSTEMDSLLRQAGYQNPDEVYNAPELSKDLVVATTQDGNRTIVSLDKLHAMTGYNKYLTNEELKTKERKARIDQMLRQGQQYAQVQQREEVVKSLMESEGIPLHEAYQRVMQMEKGQTGSGEDRAIKQIMEDEGLSFLDAAEKYYAIKKQGGYKSDKERFIERYLAENPEATPLQGEQAYAARTPTSTQKELGQIDEIKASLDESGFWDKDLKSLSQKERGQLHTKIAQIEDLRGMKLSTEDKRSLRDFRSLINLGGTVGEKLTPQETGLLDASLNSFKNYMVNEVGGKEATSAYETFRGAFRNALYGASLTDNEIKAFNAAAGTLKQKFKPAMKAFQTQLETIKSKLEAVRDTNDPYLAQFYMGSDIEQVDEVIRGIESRLGAVGQVIRAQRPDEVIRAPAEPVQDGAPRPSLEELFKRTR